MSVFSYYSFSSTNNKDVLSFIKNKLVAKGWIIDKDDIITNNKFIFHIPSTECYYEMIGWQDNDDFWIYMGSGFNGTSLIKDTVNGRNIALFCSRRPYYSWERTFTAFFLRGIDLFINNKFVLLFINYYYSTRNTVITIPFIFGQLDTDDNIQSSYMLKGNDFNSNYVSVNFHSSSAGTSEPHSNALKYKGQIHANSVVNKFFPYFLSRIDNKGGYEDFDSDFTVYNYIDNYTNLFKYNNFPEFKGRKFISSVPIMIKYVENNITYYFPVAETPFYITNYTVSDYKKVFTVNGRKFMVMPLQFITTEIFNTSSRYFYGVAIECDNI